MRYDINFAFFAPHPEWYNFVEGKGYIPTIKAPPEAMKAMQEYNSYKFNSVNEQIPKISPMEKVYENYKQKTDKTKIINGRLYYRIIHSDNVFFTAIKKEYLIVILSPEIEKHINELYEDENGNRFVLTGFHHIKFPGDIPQWYLDCGAYNMKWLKNKNIGNYISLC